MKKISVLALSTVLTAALFAGCRSSKTPMETTRPTTVPTTQSTTVPTTQATHPSTTATQPSETVDHGNGPMTPGSGTVTPGNGADGTVDDGSTETTGTSPEGRIAPMPRVR